jgi:DUF4097 and DUF4098 domain-containing protein YvlB
MYEFDRSTPVTVALRAQSGLVELTAEERATVEVDVQPFDGDDAALEAAGGTRVVLEGDTLLIRVPGGEHSTWRRTPKLRIVARVPTGSALAAKTAAAPVRAAGRWSDVEVKVASAEVHVEEATGDVTLDSAGGDLSIGPIGGSLRIKSASGNLRVGDVTGDVKAETASGAIRIDSVGGSVRAGTASGDIEIGQLRRGQASLTTASGDVRVGVASGSALWMDLNSVSGRSITDLTSHGDVPPTDGPVELELRVRTVSGDISIHRASGDVRAAA